MRRQLLPSLVIVLVFTFITGIAYPLLVTGFAQVLFHDKANGSLVKVDGQADDPSTPDVDESYQGIEQRAAAYRQENRLAATAPVPVDAVTGSASGLDPHISVANAHLQAPRVAQARNLPLERVMTLIDKHTDPRALGFLGEPGVNVLALNVDLDRP